MAEATTKICFDQSGADSDSDGFYCAAGVVGSTDQWRRFYPLWEQSLQSGKAIAYFNMNEAAGKKGQFFGWTDAEVLEKVLSLKDVIRDNGHKVMVHLTLIDRHRSVTGEVEALSPKWKSLYYAGFAHSLILVCDYMNSLQGVHSKPLLVFDIEQERIQARAHRIASAFRGIATDHDNYNRGRWIGDVIFRDDRQEERALQAADLIAWHYRRGTMPDSVDVMFDRIADLDTIGRVDTDDLADKWSRVALALAKDKTKHTKDDSPRT